MPLVDATLDETCSAPPTTPIPSRRPPEPPSPAERRAAVRRLPRKPVLIRFLVRPAFEPVVGVLENLSAVGACLRTTREVPLGSILLLELRLRDHDDTFHVRAAVQRVEPRPRGGWVLGCRLCRCLGNDEIRKLLAPDTSATAAGRGGAKTG
jgi:hypothetical protein